ncbi:MAG: hypothetical protein J6P40_07380 [Oscillospiraceae bacterium]|nr:hypothetical protein [Oscillospiraceae bacterium]
MRLIDVKAGETVSLRGCLLTYKGSENGSAIFWDVRHGKTIVYGFDAAKVLLMQFGYNLMEGSEKG